MNIYCTVNVQNLNLFKIGFQGHFPLAWTIFYKVFEASGKFAKQRKASKMDSMYSEYLNTKCPNYSEIRPQRSFIYRQLFWLLNQTLSRSVYFGCVQNSNDKLPDLTRFKNLQLYIVRTKRSLNGRSISECLWTVLYQVCRIPNQFRICMVLKSIQQWNAEIQTETSSYLSTKLDHFGINYIKGLG